MSDYTPISILRGTSAMIDQTPIVDGQILFDEGRKCLYMDEGVTRNKYSGLGADSNIATVEDTTTATHAYVKGNYVVVEGQLYEVTAAIAIGDTFTVGTNVAVTTVGTELSQINSDLTTRVKTSDIINDLASTATNKPLSANQGKVLNDGKINISDIINNLTSTATNKPLSAAQGKVINDRFVFNTLIQTNANVSITIKSNKIYLVCAHGIGDKARIGLLSTVYETHFTNLIGESSIYLNWGISGNTINFINMESTTIGLSITEL